MIRAMSGSTATPVTPPPAVLAAFGLLPHALNPAGSGLINLSWYATDRDGAQRVLQRVNPIFPAAINDDIAAVTARLADRGQLTPRLVPTTDGRLWLEVDGVVWRVLTRMPGRTCDALATPRQAREAGGVLARFHRALCDYEAPFHNARLGVHDTAAHLLTLERALTAHADHRHTARIRPLANELLMLGNARPQLPPAPDRVVHGDPKVSNIMFAADTDRALCLIDLDTLSRMPVALELGDAIRSWCSPSPEDAAEAALSLPLFEAAMQGYARAADGLLTADEVHAIVDAAFTITLELAARFCADALNERYFGWDPTRYDSASTHNLARARNQLALASTLRAARAQMTDIVTTAFRTGAQRS